VENIKWLKPVRPDDTLRLTMEVLEARVLESKPTLGLVRSRWRMFNQNNESVMTMEGHGMFRRRPST
jgi:acyl dehydratase